MNIRLLTVGFGRQLFSEGNRERQRLFHCSKKISRHDMIIFTQKKDVLEPTVVSDHFFLHPTNSANKFTMLIDGYRIGARLLKEQHHNVITAQNPFEAGVLGLIFACRYGIPLNVQEHGDNFSLPYWRRESIGNTIRYHVGKFVMRKATTVRVVANRIVDTLVSLGIAKDRILKLAVKSDVPIPGNATHKKHVTADGEVRVLTMARLEKQKNLPLLIYAFATCIREVPQAQLTIVGDGSERGHLLQLIADLNLDNNVTVVPWTDEPERYLRNAHVYALSSNYEGWGRVLVEAMAYGVPTITTDVGCAGEVLHDEKHGFVVPTDDEAAFAAKLALLLTDGALRHRFGTAAQEDVQSVHMTTDEYAAAWAEVLHSTIAHT